MDEFDVIAGIVEKVGAAPAMLFQMWNKQREVGRPKPT
jgi:hypothetical protein